MSSTNFLSPDQIKTSRLSENFVINIELALHLYVFVQSGFIQSMDASQYLNLPDTRTKHFLSKCFRLKARKYNKSEQTLLSFRQKEFIMLKQGESPKSND